VLPASTFAQQHPDFSGVYSTRMLNANIYEKGDQFMTPWAKAELAKAKPSFGPKSVLLTQTNDPVYKCLPPGVPRIYFHPFPLQIAMLKDQVVLMYEYDHTVRHVFTDGRKHPEDAEPTWLGHSIGTWEGDTLVIDTVGQKEGTWIDRVGRAHSDQLHVIEKYRKTAADNLQIEVTIDDPKAYTQKFSVTFNMQLRPKWDIAEMYCMDTLGFEAFEAGGHAPVH
jgi:hypothetical protein